MGVKISITYVFMSKNFNIIMYQFAWAGRGEINLICVDYTGTFAPNFESLSQYLKHRERQKDMAIYLLGSTWLPPVCYFKLHTLNIHFLEQRSKGIKIKWQTHIALDHHYLIPLCTATTKIKNDRTNSSVCRTVLYPISFCLQCC